MFKLSLYKKYSFYCFIIICIKLFLIVKLPLLDDEAYFIEWSKSLDIGYYEHTPLIAWVLWGLSFVSQNYIFFRLFSLIVILISAFLIYKCLSIYDNVQSILVTFVFLLGLINLLAIPLTNDIPLLLFGALALYFFIKFYDSSYIKTKFLFISFIYLGLAFLSKYIAVVWGISFLLTLLFLKRKIVFKYLVWGILVLLPFMFLNLYWNYNNCWTNVLFNLFNRIRIWKFYFPLQYLITIVLILNPFFVYLIFKNLKYMFKTSLKGFYFVFFIALINFIIFLSVSFKNVIGANWLVLFFYSCYFLAFYLPRQQLQNLIKFSFTYTLYIGILMCVFLLVIPKIVYDTDILKRLNIYHGTYVYTFTPQFICSAIDTVVQEEGIDLSIDVIATVGYSPAAILSYHCNKSFVGMFFTGPYGRFYDKKYDLRTFNDKNMIIFVENDNIQEFTSLFKHVKYKTFYVYGKYAFNLVIGKGFDFNSYKKEYLDVIISKHYNIPSWLPYKNCYMYDRYLN